MTSMINFFLENAKQTVVRAKIAISRPIYTYWNESTPLLEGYDAGRPAEDTTPTGYTSGDELPQAW